MTYTIKNPKHYKKIAKINKALFNHIWPIFIHEAPNVESDAEVLDYLEVLVEDEVSDENSPFYMYG
jgi:hypothetical protein